MIKRTFIRDCYSSNSFIDNFENIGFIILNYHIFSKNTVIERNLTRLSKNTDKKGSDLLTDNFHCSFDNRYIKNTQRYTYMLEKVNLDLIF